jgi:hypothetical protein
LRRCEFDTYRYFTTAARVRGALAEPSKMTLPARRELAEFALGGVSAS